MGLPGEGDAPSGGRVGTVNRVTLTRPSHQHEYDRQAVYMETDLYAEIHVIRNVSDERCSQFKVAHFIMNTEFKITAVAAIVTFNYKFIRRAVFSV